MQGLLAELVDKYKWYFLSIVMLFSFGILVSLPILQAGFYSDDAIDSSMRGTIQLYGHSVYGFIWDTIKAWFANGRFFPLSVLSGISIFYLFPHAPDYQIVRVIFIWLSILSFAWLLKLIAKDKVPGLLLIFLVPLCWSVRKGADPLVSFALLLPLVTLFTALSLSFFIKFQETQRSIWVVFSLLMYICALSMYELGLVTFFLLVMFVLFGPYPRKQFAGYLKPYVIITAVYAIINLRLRYNSEHIYAGIDANFSSKCWITFCKQLSTAFPLSYHVFFSMPKITFLTAENALLSVYLFVVVFVSLYYLLQRLSVTAQVLKCFFGLGTVLVLFPAFLLGLSQKYQNSLEFGKGYLPVYMQYIGMAILILVLLGIVKTMQRESFFKKPLIFSFSLLLSAVMVMSVFFNIAIVQELNNRGEIDRFLVEKALQNGLFLGLPEDAVIVEQRLLWNNLDFYRMHANAKLAAVMDLNDVNLSDSHNMFLIDTYPISGTRDGYVMMGHIKHIHHKAINTLKLVDSIVIKNPYLFIAARDLAQFHKIIAHIQSRFSLSQQATTDLTKTAENSQNIQLSAVPAKSAGTAVQLLIYLPAGEYPVLFNA